jgi:hypothetical protein
LHFLVEDELGLRLREGVPVRSEIDRVSMATRPDPLSATARVQFTKQLWKAFGRSREITVAMQSREGIPWANGANLRSQSSVSLPNSSSASQPSAPPSTAQTTNSRSRAMDTACDDRRDSQEAMKNVQECWQTWKTPEIVFQSVSQITVVVEVYMRSPCPETGWSDLARRPSHVEAARWSGFGVMPDGGKTKALGTASRRRRRLPGDTPIECELGLSDQVPVGRLVPGGRAAGGRGGSPRAKRICSTGAASVMKAMMRRLAPQLGQTSGSDSNSRASSIAHRSRAGEPDVGSSSVADTLFAGACGLAASSRPSAVTAARGGESGAGTP